MKSRATSFYMNAEMEKYLSRRRVNQSVTSRLKEICRVHYTVSEDLISRFTERELDAIANVANYCWSVEAVNNVLEARWDDIVFISSIVNHVVYTGLISSSL